MSRRTAPYRFLPVPDPHWQPTGGQLSYPERAVIACFVARWLWGIDRISIGVSLISSETGLGETATKASIARLIDTGLLVRMRVGNGRGAVSEYRLGPAVFGRKTSRKGSPADPFTADKGVAKGVAKRPKRGRHATTDIEDINTGRFQSAVGASEFDEDPDARRARFAAEKAARLEAEAKPPVKVVPLRPARESGAG